MKPSSFKFHRPAGVDEVLALLAEHGEDALVMAGGQSLMPLLNLRMVRPAVVIDLNAVGDLASLEATPDHVSVGAMARARAVEDHPGIRAALPALRDALLYVGHPQIRNRGTVGGMVAFADPAAEIPAVLVGCGGQVTLRGAAGDRVIDAGDFFHGFYDTACEPTELVTSVRFDVPTGHSFVVSEHARRHGDYALAGMVLGLRLEDRVVRGLRLTFFGVGQSPARLHDLESAFAGRELDDGAIDELCDGVESLLTPPDDVHGSGDYRRRTAAVLTRRGLRSLRDGGGGT